MKQKRVELLFSRAACASDSVLKTFTQLTLQPRLKLENCSEPSFISADSQHTGVQRSESF